MVCVGNVSNSSVDGSWSPLMQGGLEIEIEVFVQWENNDKNLKIFDAILSALYCCRMSLLPVLHVYSLLSRIIRGLKLLVFI